MILHKDELFSVGCEIAYLHKTFKEYPKTEVFRKDFFPEYLDFNTINKLRCKSELGQSIKNKEWEMVTNELKQLTDYKNQYFKLSLDNMSVIHRDLSFDHIFQKEDNYYFIDFDNVVYAPIALELAILGNKTFKESSMNFETWRQKFVQIIHGYNSVIELEEKDLSAINILIKTSMLESINYMLGISFKQNKLVGKKSLSRRVKLFQHLNNNDIFKL